MEVQVQAVAGDQMDALHLSEARESAEQFHAFLYGFFTARDVHRPYLFLQ